MDFRLVIILFSVLISVFSIPHANEWENYYEIGADEEFDERLRFSFNGSLDYDVELPIWMSSYLGGSLYEENLPHTISDAVLLRNKYAIVSYEVGGVQVYDITDRSSPVYYTTIYDDYSLGVDVRQDDDIIFITEISTGLTIYNISDLDNPVYLGSHVIRDPGRVLCIPNHSELGKDHVLVEGGASILIFDVSDLSTPSQIDFSITEHDKSGIFSYTDEMIYVMMKGKEEIHTFEFILTDDGAVGVEVVDKFSIDSSCDYDDGTVIVDDLLVYSCCGPGGFIVSDQQGNEISENEEIYCEQVVLTEDPDYVIIMDPTEGEIHVLHVDFPMFQEISINVTYDVKYDTRFGSIGLILPIGPPPRTGEHFVVFNEISDLYIMDIILFSEVEMGLFSTLYRSKIIEFVAFDSLRMSDKTVFYTERLTHSLHSLDTSYPLSPQDIGSIYFEDDCTPSALEVYDGFAYVGCALGSGGGEIRIINVSDPSVFNVTYREKFGENPEQFPNRIQYQVRGEQEILYYSVRRWNLGIWDVTDKYNPITLHTIMYEFDTELCGIGMYPAFHTDPPRHYLYVHYGGCEGNDEGEDDTIAVYNVTNFTAGVNLINEYEDDQLIYSPKSNIKGYSNYIYIADHSGVKILDSEGAEEHPVFAGIVAASSPSHVKMEVEIKGNYIYLIMGDFDFGVRVFDVSEPESYKPLNYLETESKLVLDVVGRSGLIFCGTRYSGLVILGLGTLGFNGRPGFEDCGEYYVPVELTDESGSTSLNFTVEVVCPPEDEVPPNDDDDGEGEGGESVTGGGKSKQDVVSIVLASVLTPLTFLCVCCVCCCCIFCGFIVSMCCLSILGFVSLFICGGGLSVFGINFGNVYYKKKYDLDKFDLAEKSIRDPNKASITINKKLFEIKYENLKVIKMIGEGGSSSTVFHCTWKGKDVAFKCFRTTELFDTQNRFDEFEREVEVLSSIIHPYCLNFFGCTMKPPRVGIVMEFCHNGDLKHFLTNVNENLEVSERFRVLYEVSDAMEYLHDRNVIHRDIKCENILLAKDMSSRLIDFGLSRIVKTMDVKKTRAIGTSCYMAPEVLIGENYDEKCDVFSFSIVIYEVLSNDFDPYGSFAVENIEYKIANDEWFRPDDHRIEKDVRTDNPDVIEMMRKSWSGDPTVRPSFTEIKELFGKRVVKKKDDDDDDDSISEDEEVE